MTQTITAQFVGQQDIWQGLANQAAIAHGVPTDLFSNVIGIESSWQPYTVSPAGAIGLGQLMPTTASDLGIDPWNPTQNLNGAATLLRRLYESTGSWAGALAAYNAGSPSSPAGQAYAGQVLSGVNAAGQSVGPALDPGNGMALPAGTSAATNTSGLGGIIESALNWALPGSTPVSSATGPALAQAEASAPSGAGLAGTVAEYGAGVLVVIALVVVGVIAVAMAGWKATPEPVKAVGRGAAAAFG